MLPKCVLTIIDPTFCPPKFSPKMGNKLLFIVQICWLLLSMAPSPSMAFNLYIGVDEMNRTLGISARMDYVINGQINEYSTRFPYRVAENISRIRFTWNSPGRTVRPHFILMELYYRYYLVMRRTLLSKLSFLMLNCYLSDYLFPDFDYPKKSSYLCPANRNRVALCEF